MAKVIIEVKNLQNNDLIGKIVLSKCGRDKNHYYVIVDKVDENNRFSFNNVRLNFILELAETIALSILLST